LSIYSLYHRFAKNQGGKNYQIKQINIEVTTPDFRPAFFYFTAKFKDNFFVRRFPFPLIFWCKHKISKIANSPVVLFLLPSGRK
jgi:hypothetical protein